MTLTQENKKLLLTDLSSRLPYGVICHYKINDDIDDVNEGDSILIALGRDNYNTILDDNNFPRSICFEYDEIKPYLRPLSSMTEEEMEELNKLPSGVVWRKDILHDIVLGVQYNTESIDWFNKKMFDYRGLIPKGLALPATDDMYNLKK